MSLSIVNLLFFCADDDFSPLNNPQDESIVTIIDAHCFLSATFGCQKKSIKAGRIYSSKKPIEISNPLFSSNG